MSSLKFTDADHIEKDAKDADFIVVRFSRQEVERGLIGGSLDGLLSLSYSAEFVDRFEDSMMFYFDGYDDDKRELYEIPECVTFMRKLTEAWPYWFHFLEKEQSSFAILFRLLCRVEIIRSTGDQIAFAFKDMEEVRRATQDLFGGLNTLYSVHGVPLPKVEALSGRVFAAYNRMFAN